jgi:hypothetical protein
VELSFKAKVWLWKGEAPAAWYFVTLPHEYYADLKQLSSGNMSKVLGTHQYFQVVS